MQVHDVCSGGEMSRGSTTFLCEATITLTASALNIIVEKIVGRHGAAAVAVTLRRFTAPDGADQTASGGMMVRYRARHRPAFVGLG
jgi:hypothetical protein